MSMFDKAVAGSHSESINQCDSEAGAMPLSQSIEAGSQDSVLQYRRTVSTPAAQSGAGFNSIQFEFFDKEEQKRREEYRSRVERHYCRLVEEERLSPESASVLSDAFAEAEDRAKYGSIKHRSEVRPEYHTGIDKTVWKAVDHQRSKSFERLRSKGKDTLSDNTGHCDYEYDFRGKSSLDMDVSLDLLDDRENCEFKNDADECYMDEFGSSGQLSQDFESSETVTLEVDQNRSDCETYNEEIETDEFDFENDKQREWRSKRGDLAVEKSMETWMGSPRSRGDSEASCDYKERMKQYREKAGTKEREKLKEMARLSAALPNASPTPFDYDADEETSFKDNHQSPARSFDQSWSDNNQDGKSEENVTTAENIEPQGYVLKPISSRSSVASEKSRLDPLTYQCYTAGLLHSSGKSEKFLKLQKHFAVLERIREIEDKTKILGKHMVGDTDDPHLEMELFAKYDVQSIEELQWLYQELSEAQKNAEFFYDLQKLAVFQWKPTKDHGLLRRGKSLNDLRKVYENLDEEEENGMDNKQTHLPNTFFQNAMKAEKQKAMFPKVQVERQPRHSGESKSSLKAGQKDHKVIPRALHGTNIPERLDDFEIYVESKKQKNKRQDEPVDNLHIRSMSAPYSKHVQEDQESAIASGHKRSDSSKGSLFGKQGGSDKFEKKGKPTVVEVSPVQRPTVVNKPPVFSKIISGPHDFASRATTSDSIARPMQSNLHIYNSLENPQYHASVSLDEPMNPRKLSRGRSNDNLIVQKDVNGQYFICTVDGSPKVLDQRRVSNPAISIIEEDSRGRTETRRGSSDRFRDLNSRPARSLRSGVDCSPVSSVRSVVASLENKTENLPADISRDRTRSESEENLTNRPPLVSNLAVYSIKYNQGNLKNDEYFVKSVEVKAESPVTGLKVMPFTETTNSADRQQDSLGPSPGPQFKIRDLRCLANNNEFSQYRFLPGGFKPQVGQQGLVKSDAEPVLYQPVVGQVFRAPQKRRSVPDLASKLSSKPYDRETRRNSDSSTDTFIIKASDDEEEIENKVKGHGSSRDSRNGISKSVPDLTEEFEPKRPRSAKSHGNLKHDPCDNDDDEILSGRHCIPRTLSGNLDIIQDRFKRIEEFTQGLLNTDSSGSTTPRNSPMDPKNGNIVKKQESFEDYMPPVEIMSDLIRSSEQYRRSEPRNKPKTPSVVGEMTLDYLHVIGAEWEQSHGKNKKSLQSEPVALVVPSTSPFVGSDKTTTPNKWVPTVETRQVPPDITQNVKSRDPNSRTYEHTTRARDISQNYGKPVNSEQNSFYKKYLSAPQKPLKRKSSLKYKHALEANTVPRAHADRQTNRARDVYSHDWRATDRGR